MYYNDLSSTYFRWDESFKGRADCSGRSVAGVHADAYDAKFDHTKGK